MTNHRRLPLGNDFSVLELFRIISLIEGSISTLNLRTTILREVNARE